MFCGVQGQNQETNRASNRGHLHSVRHQKTKQGDRRRREPTWFLPNMNDLNPAPGSSVTILKEPKTTVVVRLFNFLFHFEGCLDPFVFSVHHTLS